MGLFDEEDDPILTGPDVRELVDRAVSELQAKTAGHDAIIDFENASWSVDQEEGDIVFERTDGMRAVAPVPIIGTYNTTDGTWLWAWDHPSIEEPLSRDAAVVRKYGEEHEIPALTTRTLTCAETDCWEFAALACKLCDSQGAYRGPAGETLIFMTFGNVSMGLTG
jgi:hypothetical protein